MADNLLTIRGLTKSFPGTVALSDVDLTLAAKTVTCAVGHNGSGKSTIVKVLAGIYKPDAGEITSALGDDADNGIHFIHQDLGLIDDLTTIENLNLARGRGMRALASPRRSRERREAERLLGQFGVMLDVTAPLRTLTAAQRTMVAIARAMSRWPNDRQILVLDEPTATLHDKEADIVLEATRRIADRGAAVLFISHRLDEVERLADQVVVLRDGKVIANKPRGEFTAQTLVEFIAGHELEPADASATDRRSSGTTLRPLLEIRGLDGTNLETIDLDVRAGEIVGVSGVLGSGVEELLGTVFGAHPRTAGHVSVEGVEVKPTTVDAIRAGLSYVPADRHRHAAFLAYPGRENLTLPSLSSLRQPWGSISGRRERAEARRWFDHAAVHPGQPERLFAQFSGGNQQKIVLSRWMRTTPKVLLLEEPTQGVDVGAQSTIYDLIREAAAAGAAVLVASSDTTELVALCDRVIVLSDGIRTAELSGAELTEPALVRHTLAAAPATITADHGSDQAKETHT